jgi:glycosyltransferase involved in cell wall biosynthesis
MRPKKILYVDVSPTPSYGGSKRVLTNILTTIDRARWTPHVLYYRDGAYVPEVSSMGIWARAPIGLPGQDAEERRIAAEALRSQTASSAGGDGGAGRSFPDPGLRSRIAGVGMRRDASGWVERSWLRRTVRDLRSLYRFWVLGERWSRRLDPFLPSGIDLIHFNGPMHDRHYEWAHLAGRLGIPFVTHEHGPWRIPPVAFRLVARRAAAVLCLTEERVGQIAEFCRGRVRADLAPNGVAVEKLTPRRLPDVVRAEIGVDPDVFLLITPAHIQAYKGQLLAVEAAHLLAREGLDFRWVLCGAHLEREYLLRVARRIQDLELDRRIVILEERMDLPDLLAASDLLVHTSIGPEAFGMVVLEALGAGTPVIGPAEGAIPSILRDGRDGLLYEPRNAQAMADAILHLARSPETRRQMGESGRSRVGESFSLEAQARKLCEVYERALGA